MKRAELEARVDQLATEERFKDYWNYDGYLFKVDVTDWGTYARDFTGTIEAIVFLDKNVRVSGYWGGPMGAEEQHTLAGREGAGWVGAVNAGCGWQVVAVTAYGYRDLVAAAVMRALDEVLKARSGGR
jgi:hypothetical protein